MESRLLAAAVIAVGAVWAVLAVTYRGDRAAARREFDVVIAGVVGGLLVGRLAAMLLAGTNPLTRPADVLIVRGGVDTAAASIAALVVVGVLSRRRTVAVLAGLTPAALAGLAAWHAACLMRAACLGEPSGLPWAFTEPGGLVARHPVELYAAATLAFGAWLTFRALRRAAPSPTLIVGAGIAFASGARFVTEPLRPTLGTGRTAFYALALVVGLVVVVASLLRPNRSPEDRVPSPEA